MGNHDVYDTPEDRAREATEKRFQERVRTLHRQLCGMNSADFTVEEIGRLLNMPTKIHQNHLPTYSKGDLKWLQALQARVTAIPPRRAGPAIV